MARILKWLTALTLLALLVLAAGTLALQGWVGSDDVRQRMEREASGARDGTPMHPDVIYAEVRKAAPRNAIFTLDAGTTGFQATDQLPCYEAPALLTPLDCGMVGFSYSAAIGAKVAAPHRAAISLMGDGGSGMTMGEIDLYEVNEAFAPVPLAWLGHTGADPARLNVHGGAIALGHPLGASGTKLMATLVHALHRHGKKYGLQTMCEGGGVANVTIIERL